MKKILFCIDSLKPGGAEIIMCNTVNELVKDSNLDITVQLLQKEQKLNLDEKVKVNTFMNNNIFYRRIIKWMPASILHKLIIKEKYDYEIADVYQSSVTSHLQKDGVHPDSQGQQIIADLVCKEYLHHRTG